MFRIVKTDGQREARDNWLILPERLVKQADYGRDRDQKYVETIHGEINEQRE